MTSPAQRRMCRRTFLATGVAAAGWRPGRLAAEPVGRGSTRVWQPIVDLHFADDSGVAQWWVPELVLLGNTDVTVNARGTVKWQRDGTSWHFDHVNPDGQLRLMTRVSPVSQGWVATMTVENRTKQDWKNVVSPVCLLLRSAPGFADPDWSRTFFRSEGEFLAYRGQKTPKGKPIFRMSLVKGERQIERTPRHINKWGFTPRQSDDGIIGVVSRDGQSILTTSWSRVHHLQANLKATFACIHGNPWLGAIPAGESRSVQGCVVLSDGNLQGAWKNTRRILKSFAK